MLNVVFHRVLSWARYFLILMTSIFHQVYLSLYYLLMTLTTFSQMLKISNQLMANNLTINVKKTTLRAL